MPKVQRIPRVPRTTGVFLHKFLCFILCLTALLLISLTKLYAEDVLILNDGRTLTGSIVSMNDDSIIFYDKNVDSQRRIPRSSIVGGRFGNMPLGSSPNAATQKLEQSTAPPLIFLPLDGDFANIGTESLEIQSIGDLPFGDDPSGEAEKAIFGTGSGSYIRFRSTPRLNTLREFSLSFWFLSLDTGRPQYLVSKWKAAYTDTQTADGVFTVGYTKPGRLIIFLVDQDGTYHPYSIDNAIQDRLSWNHVVVTFGKEQLNVYINSNLISSSKIDYDLYQDNSSDLLLLTAISRNSKDGSPTEDLSTFNLIGQFDDFRLWDRVITADTVRSLYRNTYNANF